MSGPLPEDPRDIRPGISLPGQGAPMWLLGGLALVLGLALFLFLDGRRRNEEKAGTKGAAVAVMGQALAPPPPLALPQEPATPPPMFPQTPMGSSSLGGSGLPYGRMGFGGPFVPQPMGRAAPLDMGWRGPPAGLVGEEPLASPGTAPGYHGPARVSGLVYDTTSGTGAAINGGGLNSAGGNEGASYATTGDDTARATLIRNRGSIMPQGAILAAVLETPLNSDRPGLARAVISQDGRSFDGGRVLIPRGSRLIGEFKADTSPGLHRILVTWTRLIRPDGVAIRIGSPGADSMGGAGVPGRVNSHFAERFAGAVLQSALAIGVNVASQMPIRGGSPVYVALPGQAAALGQQFVPANPRAPTVKVREGAEIAVLVARDLDFSGTPVLP